MLFCGIDTSNYTTSAALCDENGRVVANVKYPLPVKHGECGLRQSNAVFAHIKNLPHVFSDIGKLIGGEAIAAVGVSASPRDAADSYMPCFLAGVAAAEAFAAGSGAPLYRFSHQAGHIMAAYSTSGAAGEIGCGDFLAFHVSGGTTETLSVRQTDDGFAISQIGGTEDLNAGQAIDRIGVMLGLDFPCGRQAEELAKRCSDDDITTKVSVKGLSCNLSGLQNVAEKMAASGVSPERICRFTFLFIAETLARVAANARLEHGELPIVWGGGVMSNSIIKSRLAQLGNVYFAEPQFSADNAAGIALLCLKKHGRT